MVSAFNVSEMSPLYDSVIVSQRLFGNEDKVKGWFGGSAADPWARPFEQFGATTEHIFFKDRTEGNCDLAYCNMQSAETMDFPFRAYSLGVRFWGPVSAFETAPEIDPTGNGMPPWGTIETDDPWILFSWIGHFWKAELPYHCSLEFKVENDVIAEGPAITFPPGHGFIGTGSSWSDPVSPGQSSLSDYNMNIAPDPDNPDSIVQHPQMISVVNQGEPRLGNRFNFARRNPLTNKIEPLPIEIPKGSLVQATIKLTPYAQYILSDIMGPLYYLFNRRCSRASYVDAATVGPDPIVWFGTRYGITVSLLGERLVQQRGNYFAPGGAALANL